MKLLALGNDYDGSVQEASIEAYRYLIAEHDIVPKS